MAEVIHYSSPLGMLTVAAEENLITVLVIDGQKYMARHLKGETTEREAPILKQAEQWLDRYFSGEKPDPAELSLSPKGSEFQKRVWKELLKIPYGMTDTYGGIAERLGSSARAVGSAVGRNPISILIPCHRVLGRDGNLTGYAGGVENKKKLLELEGAI